MRKVTMKQNPHKPPCAEYFSNKIKNFDSYGVPITMTYKQSSVFRTVPGGLISILSKFGILLYFLVQIPLVVEKKKEVTYKPVRQNLENDHDYFELNYTNFDVGLRVTSLGGEVPADFITNRAKYFKFDIAMTRFYQAQIGDQKVSVVETIPYELGACTADRFGNMTEETSALGITGNGWVCPVNRTFPLLGSTKTLTRDSLRVRVIPCNLADASRFVPDGIECASDAEIQKAIEDYFVQIVTFKQYFDQNEFDTSPIKNELLIEIFNIQKNQSFFKVNQLQRTNITTMDNPLSSNFDNRYYSFYEIVDIVSPITGYPKPGIHDMITILYTKYDREQEITRQVTSVLDILSKGGGFASFMMALTLYITKTFQFSLFERSLAKRLFKGNKPSKFSKGGHYEFNDEDVTNRTINEEGNANKILEQIRQRIPLDINFLKMRFLSNIYCCWCSRKTKVHKKTEQEKLKAYTHLVRSEMDIIKMAENMKKLKLLLQLYLSKQQRQLLPYLGFNLITEEKLFKKSLKLNSSQQYASSVDTFGKYANLQSNVKFVCQKSTKKLKDRVFLDILMNRNKSRIDLNMSAVTNQGATSHIIDTSKLNHTRINNLDITGIKHIDEPEEQATVQKFDQSMLASPIKGIPNSDIKKLKTSKKKEVRRNNKMIDRASKTTMRTTMRSNKLNEPFREEVNTPSRRDQVASSRRKLVKDINFDDY